MKKKEKNQTLNGGILIVLHIRNVRIVIELWFLEQVIYVLVPRCSMAAFTNTFLKTRFEVVLVLNTWEGGEGG